MTISADPIPAGFTEMQPFGPFHELVGPMYEMIRDGRSVIGLRIGEKHRNLGPAMHGGMYLMLG
jgi:acyl-coenzyme A thioesterase PaaI-like protein